MAESTDIRTEATKFWKLLDQLHSNKPEEYDKLIKQTLEEGRKIFGPPKPGYCLKLDIAPKVDFDYCYIVLIMMALTACNFSI